jgi:hypothetical protein
MATRATEDGGLHDLSKRDYERLKRETLTEFRRATRETRPLTAEEMIAIMPGKAGDLSRRDYAAAKAAVLGKLRERLIP